MGKVPTTRLLAFTLGISLILSSCQKKIDEKEQFASVNGKILSTKQLDAYKRVKGMYPANTMDQPFPGRRSVNSIALEVEAIYNEADKKIGNKIENDIDWEWKSRYYVAQNYLIHIITKNWGYTDDEVKAFYNTNIDKFTQTVKKQNTGNNNDSSAASSSDSTFTVPFEKAQPKAAIELFKSKNEPDSSFKVTFEKNGAKGDIMEAWIASIAPKKDLYFMKKYYKEKYGNAYPDSLNEVFGIGKPVKPEDLEMILNWIPERDRKSFEVPQKKRTLVEWLLKWQLFEEKAKAAGYDKDEEIKEIVKAAWKYEVVFSYLNNELYDQCMSNAQIDNSILEYQNWDRTGIPYESLNEKAIENLALTAKKTKAMILLDSIIYDYRVKADAKFLQDQYSDGKKTSPISLKSSIDSLLEAGKSMKDVKKKYKLLADEYSFTDIGQNALIELAKIKSEEGNYRGAIKDYRKYLTITNKKDKYCSVFFMIGYIYGENLAKYKLAEANYKWILKNSPDCELADDAEFMALHLGEPMIEVEELQAESKRQGKSIE